MRGPLWNLILMPALLGRLRFKHGYIPQIRYLIREHWCLLRQIGARPKARALGATSQAVNPTKGGIPGAGGTTSQPEALRITR